MSCKKLFILFILFWFSYHSQNETKKWYFGQFAAVDFMTSPPSTLLTSQMSALEGCASIADATGNLLFYTNGVKVWNQSNSVMANGTGLLGNLSATQGALIVKQPGNTNIYYLFTLDSEGGSSGLCYSIVDMNLAAGMGSVTVKNTLLYTPSCEKLTAVKHCNNFDVWIISHDWGTNVFRSYLLTNAGIPTSAVTSSIGTVNSGTIAGPAGQMKVSPNGKKIGLAIWGLNVAELFDFDNSTGIISNPVILDTTLTVAAYGCEFSPDGTKFYVSTTGLLNGGNLYQWNLCAGNAPAIIASKVLISNVTNLYGLQIGPDGKIYVAHTGTQNFGAINNPNALGLACAYTFSSISTSPRGVNNCFPNFVTSYFRAKVPAFTFTSNCQNVSFTGIVSTNTTNGNCSAALYPILNQKWDFGDPATVASNTSSVSNPNHFYSAPGTYTAQFILYYPCYSDTLNQVVTVAGLSPTFSILGPGTICSKETHTFTTSNPAYIYTWTGISATNSIVVTPTTTTIYTVIATDTITECTSQKIFVLSVNKCTGLEGRELFTDDVRIYPNPFENTFEIETTFLTGTIKIYNNLGMLVKSSLIEERPQDIDLISSPNGMYFIEVSDGKSNRVLKLVKSQ